MNEQELRLTRKLISVAMYSVYRSLEIEYGYSNYFDIVEAFHNAYNRYRDIMVSAYGESGQQQGMNFRGLRKPLRSNMTWQIVCFLFYGERDKYQ